MNSLSHVMRRAFVKLGAVSLFCAIIAGCSSPPVSQPELSDWGEGTVQIPNPPQALETPAAAPTINEGDLWIDRIRGADKRFIVGAIKPDGTVFVDEWGNQMRTTPDLNVLTYRSLTFADAPPTNYDPAMQWFEFPLEPGKTWSMTAHWQTPDFSLAGTTVVEGTVDGWEDVVVPAGTFHALKVNISNRVFGRLGTADEIDITYWWVPSVNRWVKYYYRGTTEGTVTAEMVSYQPAPSTQSAHR
jgi:hypothetical protein